MVSVVKFKICSLHTVCLNCVAMYGRLGGSIKKDYPCSTKPNSQSLEGDLRSATVVKR